MSNNMAGTKFGGQPNGHSRLGNTNFSQASLHSISKVGVVSICAEGSPVFPKKYKRFFLRIKRNTVVVARKEGQTPIKEVSLTGCSFSYQGSGHRRHIHIAGPRLSLRLKASREKDLQSWMLAFQSNQSRQDLRGKPGSALVKTSPVLQDDNDENTHNVDYALNSHSTPSTYEMDMTKPHMKGRKTIAVSFDKAVDEPLGMKICGGGGPDGDPERPEIFCLDIQPKSVAMQSGLMQGDIVVSVDGQKLAGMPVGDAARVLGKATGHVVVIVLRKDRRRGDGATATTPLDDLPAEELAYSTAGSDENPQRKVTKRVPPIRKADSRPRSMEEEESGFGFPSSPEPEAARAAGGSDDEEESFGFGFSRSNSMESQATVYGLPLEEPTEEASSANKDTPENTPDIRKTPDVGGPAKRSQAIAEDEESDVVSPLPSPVQNTPDVSSSPDVGTGPEDADAEAAARQAAREEKKRRMRESRRQRKDISMAELNDILKLIDDLEE